MRYKNNRNNIIIDVSMNVMNKVFRICDEVKNHETGGIIIGYYSVDLKKVIITDFTFPPDDSKLGSTWFIRGIKGLKKLLSNKWKVNEYYLGEWHFHPNNSANPSYQDKKQLLEISNDARFACPEPIMLITCKNIIGYDVSLNMWFDGKLIKFYEEKIN
ncbi:Mov34/MPN/PAD-1 family protein [Tissierella sp.]|uniref:Mov34/MPN/PAD-1 family protein n=1 Tax=Tissierella sp. TaxID=41274 RepID=UPI0028A6BF84|nr:Mov34/MPN/PAD-1 family protein [Tissierella sp.]